MFVGLTKRLAHGGMLLTIISWPSRAHDIYSSLVDREGQTCCHDRDCRPARYRTTAVGVEMLVDGRWLVVPGDTIQYRALDGDTGETAGGHWCGKLEYGVTYCAVLPPNSASSISSNPTQHHRHYPKRGNHADIHLFSELD
jgi:hypothetical protein